VEVVAFDVQNREQHRQLADLIEKKYGRLDILVNNAGIEKEGVEFGNPDGFNTTSTVSQEVLKETFDVNFFAPVAATLAVLPAMLERGRGTVINVSSDGGRLPSPGPGAYPSSKAALSAFTESTSFRLGPKGVHVHVVYPAFMATELGLGALERGLRRPPRLTTRSVETVSHRILAQAGGPGLEISVSGLIDAAMVFRFLLPGTYHRLRRHW